MKNILLGFIVILSPIFLFAQDLSEGLAINDLSLHPMQDVDKPDYLETIVDPSFNTTIRRITNASQGDVIVPMYSTIQAWNSDESYMILYNQSIGSHILLNGNNYQFIRNLTDINPIDLEQIFWDFNEPDFLYYPDRETYDFIKYSVSTQSKESIVNLALVSGCDGGVELGNDVQMMSWDSDVLTFRCDNEFSYSYRISTNELTTFNIENIDFAAPAVTPSGMLYYHSNSVYDEAGNLLLDLNKGSVEHSCIGMLPNGNDAYYAIAFAEGPEGGCIGDIIAHDLTTGECIPVISQSQGYDYPQSGTHMSSLAYNNTQGGWVAASMMGYDQDGQELLDQELVIVNASEDIVKVCRIGHHRSDEDEYDYWGEPHAVISPSGTRVLFASDWSGDEDGQSIDSYVVELPVYDNVINSILDKTSKIGGVLLSNPVDDALVVKVMNWDNREFSIAILNIEGQIVMQDNYNSDHVQINISDLYSGIYLYRMTDSQGANYSSRFVKK